MKLKIIAFLVLGSFLGFVVACNDEAQKPTEEILDVEKVINTNFPNERSELAVLMRSLFNDIKAERTLLANGEHSSIDWGKKYGNMLSATPTEPKNIGEVFEAYGTSFLNQLKSYQKTQENERISNYNQVINSCMGCHQTYCPGPMVVIEKLPLKIKE